MTAFSLSGLLVFFISLFFGIFVYFKKKNWANFFWLLFSVSMATWGLGAWKIGSIPYGEKKLAFFWGHIAEIGMIAMPIFFLHFVHLWLGIKKKWPLFLAYAYGVFFLTLDFLGMARGLQESLFFFPDLVWRFNSFYYKTGLRSIPFDIYLILWWVIFSYSFYEAWRCYKKSSGIKKLQIKYFILATVISLLGGLASWLSLFVNFYPYLNFFSGFYPIMMSYAIVKYRLMDIKMIMGEIGIYFLSFLVALSYSLFFFFLNQRIGLIPPLMLYIFITITVIPLFLYIFHFFEKIASKYFYYTYYALQKTIQNLSKQFNQTIELNKLTMIINSSLLDALKIDRIGIMLRKPKENKLYPQQLIKFKKEDILFLLRVEKSFLPQYFQETNKPLVREEIPFLIDNLKKENIKFFKEKKKNLDAAMKLMEKANIAVCLPLLVKKELIGIIILGDKVSGSAYTVQDLNLLSYLSFQASVAFSNALSYSEIEKRKNELERFYKLTINRELKMIELKKEIAALKGKKAK